MKFLLVTSKAYYTILESLRYLNRLSKGFNMKAKICKRCGRCCRTTPPSLLEEDIGLVGPVFDFGDLYTIREGETVWDNLEDKLIVSPYELIKIKETADGECIFYNHNSKSCTIYDSRPLQCREFYCTDPSDFFKAFEKPKLTRAKIFSGNNILKLIEEHERQCNHTLLDSTIKSIETDGDSAVEKIIRMLRYDYEIRILANSRLNIDQTYMDLLFGRPLSSAIKYYGLLLRQEGNSFYLTLSPDYQKAPS